MYYVWTLVIKNTNIAKSRYNKSNFLGPKVQNVYVFYCFCNPDIAKYRYSQVISLGPRIMRVHCITQKWVKHYKPYSPTKWLNWKKEEYKILWKADVNHIYCMQISELMMSQPHNSCWCFWNSVISLYFVPFQSNVQCSVLLFCLTEINFKNCWMFISDPCKQLSVISTN